MQKEFATIMKTFIRILLYLPALALATMLTIKQRMTAKPDLAYGYKIQIPKKRD